MTPPNLPSWLTKIAHRMREPLPGWSAQRLAAPKQSYGRHAGPARWSAKEAVVMLIFYPTQRGWVVPLTVRPMGLSHGGQVSLPGGRREPGETAWETACRELKEELGIDPPTPLGELTPMYVFASDHWVRTCVAYTTSMPQLDPCPNEVAVVLEKPLEQLTNERWYLQTIPRGRFGFLAPGFDAESHFVWGATAMILKEFTAILEQAKLSTDPLPNADGLLEEC